jgi:hypothetical protein
MFFFSHDLVDYQRVALEKLLIYCPLASRRPVSKGELVEARYFVRLLPQLANKASALLLAMTASRLCFGVKVVDNGG